MKRVVKNITNSTYEIYDDIKNIKIDKDTLYGILLSIKEKDVTSSFIFNIFGDFEGNKLCNPYDIMDIPANTYHGNKNKFTTTVGIWLFNKYFIDKELFDILGYINETVNKKMYGKIDQKLAYAVIEDKITTDQFQRFLQKYIHMASFEIVLCPNHSEAMLSSTKKIDVKKQQLLKEYKEQLNSKDNNTVLKAAEDVEKQLIDYAKEILKDDDALDTFLSGAQGDIGNNFKNMFIMKGAVIDTITGQAKVLESNYADGVKAEEYADISNTLTAGPYFRAKKTETGGYWEKLFVSAFQHLTLDDPGSDCGTKRTISVNLNSDNVGDWMYSYIVEGNNLVELTSDNMDKYIGKRVKFRFSALCESKTGFCNKCFGNLFYRIGIKNVGASSAQIPSKLKLICMKQFHDSTIRTTTMDICKAFGVDE